MFLFFFNLGGGWGPPRQWPEAKRAVGAGDAGVARIGHEPGPVGARPRVGSRAPVASRPARSEPAMWAEAPELQQQPATCHEVVAVTETDVNGSGRFRNGTKLVGRG